MSHAYFPPSGAHSWLKCAMWPTMNRLFPRESGSAANEGSAAHWVAEEILKGRIPPEGSATPKGPIVTDEMIEGGKLLAETVRTRMSPNVHIEEKLLIPFIHETCYGTPDAWDYSAPKIEIIDYKFGHGFVDEYFNLQGICYFLGVINKLGFDGRTLSSDQVKCSFTVVQPRCYYKGEPVRTHSFPICEALPIINQLKQAVANSLSPQPKATTNENCRYCPGRHACGALQQAAYEAAERSTDQLPVQVEATAAALELRMLERSLAQLQARVDGLRELTLNNIKAGRNVPYYHIEQGKGRAAWNVPVEQVIALGSLYGKNLEKPTVITPNQALKLGIDENIVKAYSFAPTGELKLVADNPSDARRVFGIKESHE